MVNYFIYAKDFSASTNGMRFYHSHGLKTLYQFKKDVKKIQKEILTAGETPTESRIAYLHWGEACYEVSENETRKTYHAREGDHDATDPTGFINWIRDYNNYGEGDTVKLLYIITDGLISENLVQKCFELNKKMHYEKVIFHAFSENLRAINLSVAASFLKGQCMIYRNNELYDNVDMSTEYNYDKINLHNFAAEREHLKSYIKIKYISKFKYEEATAFQEIEKLKNLRNRLFRELSLMETDKKENTPVNLETKDKTVFLREIVKTNWYKSLNESVNVEKNEIEKSISTLINYIVNDIKSYEFDALKFDKIFDKTVNEEELTNIDFATEQEIEFPDIILEDEKGIPVILLTDCSLMDKIIFHNARPQDARSYRQRSQKTQSTTHTRGRQRARSYKIQLQTRQRKQIKQASYSKFKSTTECPLYLIDDKEIMESIGHFYTLNVYKQLLSSNMTDPLTRKQFRGGLVLIDSDQFDKYNDYILALTYFKGNLEVSKEGRGVFEICERTFRPFYTIDQHKSFYEELVKNTRKVQISNDDETDKIEITYGAIDSLEMNRVLSRYKLFIDCVRESEKYPTLSEYVAKLSKSSLDYDELHVQIFVETLNQSKAFMLYDLRATRLPFLRVDML
ncbi:early 94 kDa protein [Phthorimaea operculella]|nr:early 94 kDa protein [Phthorimaea operculella]